MDEQINEAFLTNVADILERARQTAKAATSTHSVEAIEKPSVQKAATAIETPAAAIIEVTAGRSVPSTV